MNKKMQLYNRLHKLNTAQIITLGFAGVIILGGLLLWLPFCTAPGYHTSFTDAMFTATTSICVTGLVTVVTATHWTLAGKIIILVLIQIGGDHLPLNLPLSWTELFLFWTVHSNPLFRI